MQFNFENDSFVQVKMTTGATIHTTDGLKMTVSRRVRPPIVPTLEMPALNLDSSAGGVTEKDPLVGQTG